MVIFSFQAIQIRLLKANKVFTFIFAKYFDYTNIFLPKLIIKLLKYTDINNYAIKLEKNKQLSYSLIYSLELIEQKMLKTYIEANPTNNFIKTFKLLVRISIFFNCIFNKNFYLYINYCNLNNLIIKS